MFITEKPWKKHIAAAVALSLAGIFTIACLVLLMNGRGVGGYFQSQNSSGVQISAPFFTATNANSTSTVAGALTNALGDNLANTATRIVSCGTATRGAYATIQSAINSLPSGGGEVFVKSGTCTLSSGAPVVVSSTRVSIIGEGNSTLIQCNGATVNPCIRATSTSQVIIKNLRLLQTNGTRQGVGLDASNSSNVYVSNLRIEGFGTGLQINDTASLSFYSSFRDIQFFDDNTCISILGTQANQNLFDNIRCRPAAGGGGTGVSIVDARGLTFTNLNVEPSSGAGITGVSVDATSRELVFINPWIEGNSTGTLIAAGANRITFIGGSITSNLQSDIEDSATNTAYIAVSDTGVTVGRLRLNQLDIFEATDVASAATTTLGIGNIFSITGTTAMNCIVTTGLPEGKEIHLFFTASLTFAHNAAGCTSNAAEEFLLNGAANFSATANDNMTLILKDGAWHEVARTVI